MLQEPTWLTISWRDTFENEQGFRVERRVDADEWTALETLPAVDGGSVSWDHSLVSSDAGTYRVVVLFEGYSVPLYAAPGESELSVELSSPAQIALAGMSGAPVEVRLSNAAPALSVTYRLNDVTVAHVTDGVDFAATIPTERIATNDGWENWTAEIRKSAGLTVLSQRYRRTSNPLPAVLLQAAPARSAADSLVLTAIASSEVDIVSVEFFANDTSLQVVRSPDRSDKWVHELDPADLPSGPNSFRALATDASGATVSMDVNYTVDELPALSVEGPFDGMIASSDTLNLSGTFPGDADGSLLIVTLSDPRTTATQRNTTLLRTRNSPFTLDYPVEDLSGERVLSFRVETPDGKVNVRSYDVILPATDRNYELIGTDVLRLLAAEDGVLLYEKKSGAVVLRNAAGEETDLQVPQGMYFRQWWLSAGHVVAQQRGTLRVHTFSGPGTTIDISTLAGETAPFYLEPQVRDRWVSWRSIRDGHFRMYNLDTGVPRDIHFSTATYLHYKHDMVTTSGSERLIFPGGFGGDQGIFSYELATGNIELLLRAPDSYMFEEIRTDGTRLAWQEGANFLRTAPLSNPTDVTTLTDEYGGRFFVEDGLVGWWARNPSVGLDDGSTTTRLVETDGAFEEDAFEDGRLVVSEAGGLSSWNVTSGKQPLLDAIRPVLHTQGVAYLLTSDTGTMYRTTLP